jgi:hypothetical protein
MPQYIQMSEEYYYLQSDGSSSVFRAKYGNNCATCQRWIGTGEPMQFVRNAVGHPVTCVIDGRPVRECENVRHNYGSRVEVCNVTDINARVRAAETALSELYAKQEAVKSFGKDAEYPDGAVLLYKPYGGYWRTAVKVSSDCWHLSAANGGFSASRTWDRVIEENLLNATEIWFGTEFMRLK